MKKCSFLLLIVIIFTSKLMFSQVPFELWGVTGLGGDGAGVIFKTDSSGNNYQVMNSFRPNISGSSPQDHLMLHPNGKLYGVTASGGFNNLGVIYEYDPSTDIYLPLFDFDSINGSQPIGTIVFSGTKFYGLASKGGLFNKGVLFEYDPVTDSISNKLSFTNDTITGNTPQGSLIEGADGKLYGLTYLGGRWGAGVLFSFDPATDLFSNQFNFSGSTGAYPNGSLVLGSTGNFYGVTQQGGLYNDGTIFEFDPITDVFVNRVDLIDSTGSIPNGSLIEASDGNLYGLASEGGLYNNGVLFQYNLITNTYVRKIDFDGIGNGSYPRNSLFEAANGNLYGLTQFGGVNNYGVLFEYNYSTNFITKKYDFDNALHGKEPIGGLVQALNGKLYGTTNSGGRETKGVLFEYDLALDNLLVKKNFSGAAKGGVGKDAWSSLILCSNNKLYGCTSKGGLGNRGVLFEYDPQTDEYIVRTDFSSSVSGPIGSPLEAANGLLYGMTSSGAIYEFNLSTNTLIFKTAGFSGAIGSLIQASNGLIYGMSYNGGSYSGGELFEYDISTNTRVVKVNFDATITGYYPYGSLLETSPGTLYGMTSSGAGFGKIFEYDILANTITIKHSFDVLGGGGGTPKGSLIMATNGLLYGLTENVSTYNGVLFEYSIAANTYTVKHTFTPLEGINSMGSLTQAQNGKLYGLASWGGTGNLGTLFEYDYSLDVFSKKVDFIGTNGGRPFYTKLLEICQSISTTSFVDSLLICAGNVLTLNPNAIGSNLSYQWYHNGAAISGEINSAYIDFYPTSLDTGFYYCTISNGCRVINTDTIYVQVSSNSAPSLFVSSSATSVCAGSEVVLIGAGGNIHSWSGGIVDSVGFIAPVGSNYYTLIGTDTITGCSSDTIININVNPNPVAINVTGSPTLICPTDSVMLSTNSSAGLTYEWLINGNVIVGATDSIYSAQLTGIYNAIVTNTFGCIDTSVSISVFQQLDCDTWPGDTDNDSVVDNNDLLPIGLYYGQSGSARSGGVSNLWQAWPSTDWGIAQVNGQDIKHSDCNGDGVIDNNDTLAINSNFSLTHAFTPLADDQRIIAPDIYLVTTNSSYLPGDWVDVEVWLGSSALPVSDLYGIAFNINYDVSLVQPGSESLTYPASWLGTPGVDAIKLSKIDGIAAKAYGAETRITQTNVDGFGKIADFKFQLRNTISVADSLSLSISYYNAIDSAGNPVLFNAQDLTLSIPVGILEQEILNEIRIFPNPYSAQTQISYSLKSQCDVLIEVYNPVGQIIETLVSGNQSKGEYTIPFSSKQKEQNGGLYFVKITIDGRSITKRIVEIR